MKRDPQRLERSAYDLIVVGAGIYGACIAWDAASRGLRVALIERGDFGAATSHNSLKLIHGGLRYLQHLDIRRMRISARERWHWLSSAPHLVKPLKFVMPLYGHLSRGPEALLSAIKIYELLTRDFVRDLPPEQRIPPGGVISRSACLELLPGVADSGLTGGAVWHDGQMQDADRVLLECVRAAESFGAEIVNYMAVESLIVSGTRVEGVRATDLIDGGELEIRSALTVNATGPWIGCLLESVIGSGRARKMFGLSKALNLVTRPFFEAYAAGVVSQRASDAVLDRGGRLFFITPWRGRSVIGTSHLPYHGHPDDYEFTDREVEDFLAEINRAYLTARLAREDIVYCYAGLTPSEAGSLRGEVRRSRQGDLVDHWKTNRIQGLISVVGAKYTTARFAAEKAVDVAFAKLGRNAPPCTTAGAALPGARGFHTRADLQREAAAQFGNPANHDALLHLLEAHGSAYRDVMEIGEVAADRSPDAILRGRWRYAVRAEMAMRLSDIVFRRTDAAVRDELSEPMLLWAADMMAGEFGWSETVKQHQLGECRRLLGRHRVTIPDAPDAPDAPDDADDPDARFDRRQPGARAAALG